MRLHDGLIARGQGGDPALRDFNGIDCYGRGPVSSSLLDINKEIQI